MVQVHHHIQVGARGRGHLRTGRARRRGMTLIEIAVAMPIVLFAFTMFVAMLVSGSRQKRINLEQARVSGFAEDTLERMRNEDLRDLYPMYNADPFDDPIGPGTAPGNRFTIPGLDLVEGDEAHVEIFLPVRNLGTEAVLELELREDLEDADLGTPRDLNGDTVIDDRNHATDYTILPVHIRVRWQSRHGPREFHLSTILTEMGGVMGTRRTQGFTLIEIILALALLAIVASKAMVVMNSATEASRTETTEIALENQARQVLKRIGRVVLGAYEESLSPVAEAPFDSQDLGYQVYLGIEDGEVVLGDPERIGVTPGSGRLTWSQRPGAENELSVGWTNLVAPFLEGEIPNGMDDNGNGLIDERGLSFVIDRRAVTIRLTLERQGDGGERTMETVETTVTCRNLTPSE